MRMKNILFFILFIFMACVVAEAKIEPYTLTWEANSEPDLAGYRVYKGTVDGGPYAMIEDLPGIPPAPAYSGDVSVIEDKVVTFYFVVTAYDTSGLESDYSNQVFKKVDNRTPPAAPKNLNWFQKAIAWIKNIFKRTPA
jgi:hypothetical protein